MEWIFVLILFVILVMFVLGRSGKKANDGRRRGLPMRPAAPAYDESKLPDQLGLRPAVGLDAAAERLEAALPKDFQDKLRSRVLAKYPGMSEAEFACHWFELKRYFLMTLLLKNTPMFSDKVDDIWHEMLMFTREYAQFCEAFAGSVIHHAPHGDSAGTPMPNERAWFDWLYAHLFESTPFSAVIWGGFFRNPLEKSRLERIAQDSQEQLAAEWFRSDTQQRYPEVEAAIQYLITEAKREVSRASHASDYEETPWFNSTGDVMLGMAGTMLFFSLLDGVYTDRIAEVMPEELDPNRKYDSTSCTAGGYYDDSSCSGDGESDGGDSGDSGSSSCSSSSCSSCGGGGGD